MGFRPVVTRPISSTADQERGGNVREWDLILRCDAPARLWSASWDQPALIRVLPAVEGGNIQPTWVPNPEGGEMAGSWICRFHVVRFFGPGGLSFILDCDGKDTRELESENPVCRLRNTVTRAMNSHQDRGGWSGLVTKQRSILAPRKISWFVQCFMFRHNGENKFKPGERPVGARPDDRVVVFQLPETAGGALLREMRSKEPWQHDPVAPTPGGYVHVFQKGRPPQEFGASATSTAVPYDPMAASPSAGGGRGGEEGSAFGKSYDVRITRTMFGRPTDPGANLGPWSQLIIERVKPWDKIFQIYAYEDQLQLICKDFLKCDNPHIRDILIDVTKTTFRPNELPDDINNYGRELVQAPGFPAQPAAMPSPVMPAPGYVPQPAAADMFNIPPQSAPPAPGYAPQPAAADMFNIPGPPQDPLQAQPAVSDPFAAPTDPMATAPAATPPQAPPMQPLPQSVPTTATIPAAAIPGESGEAAEVAKQRLAEAQDRALRLNRKGTS